MLSTKFVISKLKKIFDSSLEGVVISDMRQKDEPIIYCNSTFSRMSGYQPGEVIGKNCRFLQGDERDQPGISEIRQALKAARSCKVVLRNYKKDGTLFFNRLSLFPVKNSSGDAIYYIGIQDDVTDIIDTRKQLKKSESDKEALIEEVHHRVKNNLAVISAMLDMESFNEFSEDAVEKSSLRVKSMAMIHEKIYEIDGYSKILFNEHVQDFCKYIHNEYSTQHGLSDVKYRLHLEQVELSVNQAVPLGIAIGELLQNIYKHAFNDKRSGTITIDLRKKEGLVKLTIKDNGSGLDKAFDPLNITTTGWLICMQSLKQIEAKVEVPQTALGTEFNISFPVKMMKGSSQNRRILVEMV